MEEQFWIDAWSENRIGFHMSEYNPLLKWFMDKSHFKPSQTVLVPLCGKTLDLIFLKEQGLNVIGVEITKKGVEDFFKENDLSYEIIEIENFSIYKSEGISIYCGDIFNITKELIREIDFIFDRAATVALPPEMRANYFDKLIELANTNTEILFSTAYSDHEDLIGPPFSVKNIELENAFKEVSTKFEVIQEKKMKINSKRLRDLGVCERTMAAHHIIIK